MVEPLLPFGVPIKRPGIEFICRSFEGPSNVPLVDPSMFPSLVPSAGAFGELSFSPRFGLRLEPIVEPSD